MKVILTWVAAMRSRSTETTPLRVGTLTLNQPVNQLPALHVIQHVAQHLTTVNQTSDAITSFVSVDVWSTMWGFVTVTLAPESAG